MQDDRRRVQIGVIEFASERLNPGLARKFSSLTEDLAKSASIVDAWLMDIEALLEEYGYALEVYSTVQLENSQVDDWRIKEQPND